MPPKSKKTKAKVKSRAITPFRFQDLSAEIRIKIYKEVFKGAYVAYKRSGQGHTAGILDASKTSHHRNVLMTSKAIYTEAVDIYRQSTDLLLAKGTWDLSACGAVMSKHLPHVRKMYLAQDSKLTNAALLNTLMPDLRGIQFPKLSVDAMGKYGECEDDLWEQLLYYYNDVLPNIQPTIEVNGSVNVEASCSHCPGCGGSGNVSFLLPRYHEFPANQLSMTLRCATTQVPSPLARPKTTCSTSVLLTSQWASEVDNSNIENIIMTRRLHERQRMLAWGLLQTLRRKSSMS